MTPAERIVIEGLSRYEEQIRVPAVGLSSSFIQKILAENPRLGFFISGIRMRSGGMFSSTHILEVSYREREVPLSEIRVIATKEEYYATLRHVLGNFKPRAFLLVDPRLDIGAIQTRFSEDEAVQYPNFKSISTSQARLSLIPYVMCELTIGYRIGRATLELMETYVNEEVARLSALLFKPGMPDESKILLAYRYLATTVTYFDDTSASELKKSYQQSAYGALVKHSCVCQGYAEAFYRLMEAAGITADVVCGTVAGEADHHAWNTVTLKDGTSYHVDATWSRRDDGRVIYDYYGLRDGDLSGSRRWNRACHVSCTSSASLLMAGQRYLTLHKAELMRAGIPPSLLIN